MHTRLRWLPSSVPSWYYWADRCCSGTNVSTKQTNSFRSSWKVVPSKVEICSTSYTPVVAFHDKMGGIYSNPILFRIPFIVWKNLDKGFNIWLFVTWRARSPNFVIRQWGVYIPSLALMDISISLIHMIPQNPGGLEPPKRVSPLFSHVCFYEFFSCPGSASLVGGSGIMIQNPAKRHPVPCVGVIVPPFGNSPARRISPRIKLLF